MPVCPSCGGITEGKVCQYCRRPLEDNITQPANITINNYWDSGAPPLSPTTEVYDQSVTSPEIQQPRTSKKSWWVVAVCGLFFGLLGVHRFYVRKIGSGILWFFTAGCFFVGWAYDLFQIFQGKFRDKRGAQIPLPSTTILSRKILTAIICVAIIIACIYGFMIVSAASNNQPNSNTTTNTQTAEQENSESPAEPVPPEPENPSVADTRPSAVTPAEPSSAEPKSVDGITLLQQPYGALVTITAECSAGIGPYSQKYLYLDLYDTNGEKYQVYCEITNDELALIQRTIAVNFANQGYRATATGIYSKVVLSGAEGDLTLPCIEQTVFSIDDSSGNKILSNDS